MSVAQRSLGREAAEGKDLTRGPVAGLAFPDLPTLDLEDPLNSILVLAQ